MRHRVKHKTVFLCLLWLDKIRTNNRAGKIRCTLVSCTCCALKVPKIFIFSYLYLHYKFRSSPVTDKQKGVGLNIISVHLSAFADFINIFIRYRSKQCTSGLSVMAAKMVSTTVFFL